MSWRVQFAPEALDELDAIEDYIAHAGSSVVAVRYVDAIVAYCESLSTFLERGIRRDDLLPGLRITNYRRNAVIAFAADPSAETVTILGVFYGGRDYEAVLQDDLGG
ncbi:type II toxin-antitoxin system RelE/ParE family toxin [Luteimonas salinilitoris]|uniref:Type II toxin-antitoxin system RelE/ParE family toxin n=1 Tax=Luteimonas salinilitoris TaxID=3237697 RepID=A0ABV4HUB8_9GAMM